MATTAKKRAYIDDMHASGESTVIRGRRTAEQQSNGSWWATGSRKEFSKRARAEQDRIRASSFGRASWEKAGTGA